MSRRRARRRRRQAAVASTTGEVGSAPRSETPALVPWRKRMAAALRTLDTWIHDHHGATITAALGAASGDAQDRAMQIDEFVCRVGSAPDGRSLVRACAAECADLDDEARDQFVRWERERRRGVFVIQRAHRDALETWDPLEGAPLTLHLLTTPTERERLCAVPGTVITATYRPWLARLVAVQPPEYFAGDEALPLFRREVTEGGATWHPMPAVAPQRRRARAR